MTENERKVLEVLAKLWRDDGPGWQPPMYIGLKCFKPYRLASSWACYYLRHNGPLRDRGLVEWRAPGLYAITDKGIAELEKR